MHIYEHTQREIDAYLIIFLVAFSFPFFTSLWFIYHTSTTFLSSFLSCLSFLVQGLCTHLLLVHLFSLLLHDGYSTAATPQEHVSLVSLCMCVGAGVQVDVCECFMCIQLFIFIKDNKILEERVITQNIAAKQPEMTTGKGAFAKQPPARALSSRIQEILSCLLLPISYEKKSMAHEKLKEGDLMQGTREWMPGACGCLLNKQSIRRRSIEKHRRAERRPQEKRQQDCSGCVRCQKD